MSQRGRKTWRQRGDTLVEVTLAFAIIGTVMGSSINLASAAFRTGQLSRQRIEAADIMQEQAEQLRALRDDQLTGGEAGWTAFVQEVDAAAIYPIPACGSIVPNIGFALQLSGSDGNTWTQKTGTPSPTPAAGTYTSNQYDSVQGQHGTYDTWVELCSLDAIDGRPQESPTIGVDPKQDFDLNFTIYLQWQGEGNSSLQTAALSTELADITSIPLQPLSTFITTTPAGGTIAAPSGLAMTIDGTLEYPTINNKVYDSGQCNYTVNPKQCELPEFSYSYTAGNPYAQTTCTITDDANPALTITLPPASSSGVNSGTVVGTTAMNAPAGTNSSNPVDFDLTCTNPVAGNATPDKNVVMHVITCEPEGNGGVPGTYGMYFNGGNKQKTCSPHI